ncbi:MAG: metallophosphoesterase family protein [Anaerolineae bacterium]|nr:metallophosphoesterase family protein [Anaerolineae bacterium]
MRFLIISDIHANLAALQAVLSDAKTFGFDAVWCLGDLVGYGPDPNGCIERIQDFDHVAVAGNHDWASLGKLNLEHFNVDARAANTWTQEQLSEASREYLEALPTHLQQEGITLTHGSPREPIWEYILEVEQALINFRYFTTSICLVGHTHIPTAFLLDESKRQCHAYLSPYPAPLPIYSPNTRLILNPGSVGQPRDGDPRASYAILDSDAGTWEHRRVEYAVEITQERMRARNLPRRLITRLQMGR